MLRCYRRCECSLRALGKGLAQLLPRDLAVHLEAAIALAVACMKKKGEFRKSALNEAASVRRAWPVALTRHIPHSWELSRIALHCVLINILNERLPKKLLSATRLVFPKHALLLVSNADSLESKQNDTPPPKK